MQIILASNSPRRKEILGKLGYKFEIKSSNFIEQNFCSDAIITAKNFALGKAKDVFDNLANKDNVVVLGFDTVVYFEGQILGKAKNDDEAFKMLRKLSNNTHFVVSGFAIITKKQTIVDFDESKVVFNDLSDNTIMSYIKSGLYKGKAGAYGIQDVEYPLVKTYQGSLNNIIGLPTEKIIPILNEIVMG